MRADAQARYATPEEAVAVLSSSLRAVPSSWMRVLIGVAVVALPVTVVAVKRLGRSQEPSAVSPLLTNERAAANDATSRALVAVFTPRALTASARGRWLGAAVAEMLTTEVAATGTVRTVAAETVAQFFLAEQSKGSVSTLAKRAFGDLGASYVVSGTYAAVGAEEGGPQPLRVDLEVRDGRTGEVLGTVRETGSEVELFDMVTRLGRGIRILLGAEAAEADLAPRHGFPRHPHAARLYLEGVARARIFELIEARDLLRQAAAAEPGVALVHMALSQVHAALGDDPKAAAEAKRAWDDSNGLPTDMRLSVDAAYREASKDWPEAVRLRTKLYRESPSDVQAGLALAHAQTGFGDGRGALSTLEEVRKSTAGAADPRVDLEQGWAANLLGDQRLREAAVRRAIEKGHARGALQLEAEARDQLGWALVHQARFDEAMPEYVLAEKLFEEVGYRGGVGKVLHSQGNLLLLRGETEQGVAREERALDAIRASGNRLWEAWSTNCFGNGLAALGRLREAASAYERSGQLAQEVGAPMDEAIALVSLGEVRARQGLLSDARDSFTTALASGERLQSTYVRGIALRALGKALADAGDEAAGERSLSASETALREQALTGELAQTLFELGIVRERAGRWNEGRANLDEAARLLEASRSPGLAEAYSALAEGALRLSDGPTAEGYIRRAVLALGSPAETVVKAPSAARVHAVRARIWFSLQRRSAARAEASRAMVAVQRLPEDRRLNLEVRIMTARARGIDVIRTLEAYEASAREMGEVALATAARFEREP